MKNQGKVKWIDVDIYKTNIAVFIGTHENFKRWIKKEYTNPDERGLVEIVEESDDSPQASLWWCGDRHCIIELPVFPKKPEEISWANHELMHAVFHILDGSNVEYYKHESNEPFTYLMEFLSKHLFNKEGYSNVE